MLEILPHLKTTEIIGQRPNTSCLAMTKSEYLILSRCLTLRLIEIRNTPNLNCKTMEPIMQNYVFLTNWTLHWRGTEEEESDILRSSLLVVVASKTGGGTNKGGKAIQPTQQKLRKSCRKKRQKQWRRCSGQANRET